MHKRCIQMQCNCTNKLSKVRLRNWICFSSGVLRNTCAASDQVAESYDLARATLATKLATMSTKNECTISRNSLHWRSNTRNYTPQAFWWRPSFACSTRSPRCYPKGKQHSSQRRLDAHKQLAQKNAFQRLMSETACWFLVHARVRSLLQGAEHVSPELAAIIFHLSDHRNLQ